MKKLRTFNHILWKSISSLRYYQDIVTAKFSFSFKFYLMFSLLLSLTLTLSLSIIIVPFLTQFSSRFEKRAPNLFPQDLAITLKEGEVTTNAVEPLRFPIPFELLVDVPGAVSDQNQKYLLTIDTKANSSDFAKSQSLILVTKNEVVLTQNNDNYQVVPFDKSDEFLLNFEVYQKFLQDTKPFIRFLPVISVLLIFFVFSFIFPLLRLIFLIIITPILFAAARLMGLNLSMGKITQLGLHALTLPTLLQILFISFGANTASPLFFAIAFFLYILVILAELRRSYQFKKQL